MGSAVGRFHPVALTVPYDVLAGDHQADHAWAREAPLNDIDFTTIDPTIRVRLGHDGRPLGAAASARIDRPLADVWAAVVDIERYARHLPMVGRVRRRGDSVTFELKFKLGLFSAGFEFTADVRYEEERTFEMRWSAGEPRDIRLGFGLTPVDDGKACIVEGDVEFDPTSLGWLAKFFLKHHPEIQFGVFPGVALVLLDALRRAVAAAEQPDA